MTFYKKLALLMGASAIGLFAANPVLADFTVYDYDNDGYWEEAEWVDYSYDTIDYDNDGVIDEDEWASYSNVWYEPYDYNYGYDLEYYDTDNDGYLDEDEWENAYNEDLYEAWDYDNDGFIEETEYNYVYNTYADIDNDDLYEW